MYAAWVAHPVTGRVVCGYVGKRSGHLHVRIGEHMYGGTSRQPQPSPWSDTVVVWKVLYAGECSRFTLWWLEIVAITLLRPLYNYEWNRLNPRRIELYVAARRERSAACLARVGGPLPWRLRLLRTPVPARRITPV